jgi:hypothetical protein
MIAFVYESLSIICGACLTLDDRYAGISMDSKMAVKYPYAINLHATKKLVAAASNYELWLAIKAFSRIINCV